MLLASQEPQAPMVLEAVEAAVNTQAVQAVQAKNTTPHTAPVVGAVEVVETMVAAQLELAAQEAPTVVEAVEAVFPQGTSRLAAMVRMASL